MAREIRLANKTMWALEDIVAYCRKAENRWVAAMDELEKRGRIPDPAIAAYLGYIRDDLANILSLAIDARQGKYKEIDGPKKDTK